MRFPLILLCWLLLAGLAGAQQPATPDSSAEQVKVLEQRLRRALAGPGEESLKQVLAAALLVRDELSDSLPVYDLVVRFDPRRYQSPHAGLYPLTFEDQFVFWGKRLAVFCRSTRVQTGRYYLHDVATGRQAWIATDEARLLYRPPAAKLPPAVPAAFSRWLPLIDAVDAHTDLRSMGRWLQLMREESRDQTLERRRREAAQPPPILPEGNP